MKPAQTTTALSILMCMTIGVAFGAAGTRNLLINPTFRGNAEEWNISNSDDCTGKVEAVREGGPDGKPAIRIHVSLPHDGSGRMVLGHGLKGRVTEGKSYHFKMKIKGDTGEKLNLRLLERQDDGAKFVNIAEQKRFDLTSDLTQVEHTFTPETSAEEAVIAIGNFGSKEGAIWIAEVELVAK
jgi:hypothetical protein